MIPIGIGSRDFDELSSELLIRRSRGGFLGRRAHRLVYFIESHVANHKEQLRWACRVLLGKDQAEWTAKDVLSGFALRDFTSPRIGVHDLERHAASWGRLVPSSPGMRAVVFHILAGKYKLAQYHIPNIRAALSLSAPRVQEAYLEEYGEPIASALGGTRPTEGEAAGDRDAASEDLLAGSAEWLFVPGGSVVARQGEPMDALFVVASGRLRTEQGAAGQGRREYVTGDVLGEIQILAGGKWPATVHAARDSELVRFSGSALRELFDAHPRQGVELARALLDRAKRSARRAAAMSVAVLALDDDNDASAFAQALAGALDRLGSTLLLDARQVDDAVTAGASGSEPGDDLDGMVAAWLSEQESNHRYVVYLGKSKEPAWLARCLRQADRVVVVARAGSDPAPRDVERPLLGRSDVHLVLLHPDHTKRPAGTAAWLSGRSLRCHHHVRLGVAADVERAARITGGEAVGIALGGGGARGFAHAGVLRALSEEDVALDVYGGTSMGAVGAGLAALGWTPDEILGLGKRLTRRRALLDYTLPMMSLTRGRRLTQFLKSIFGDARIEDLWHPYFCVSTNMSKGEIEVHRQGPLWEAVRASVALPGIFSPVVKEGEILTDGAVLNNLPCDVMRELFDCGTVIGVQVSPPSGGYGTYRIEQDLSGWAILARRINPLRRREPAAPSIVSILLRTVEVKEAKGGRAAEGHGSDILIRPDTSRVRLLDFSAYKELGELGYAAAKQILGTAGAKAALDRSARARTGSGAAAAPGDAG